jgi:1,4-alpha-glucan branching enzyme
MRKLLLFCITIIFSGCVTVEFIKNRIVSPEVVGNKVIFRYESASATFVTVAGEFNGWEYKPEQYRAIKMKKVSDTLWEAEVENIPPGRYQYKFVVDGQTWILDPYNPYVITDPSGNRNSLLIVR